ncbi:hypothetical protein HCH_05770 [Hahella chejuensis KCTC 2396]|uniref:Uncharacterized protein n=1 Tax=Hahella chejuensis (strain KCTC 2396) TaxID=349521 RepID=Q2SAA3_HAHCH|nr:hypothetical protein HCH_05770 [Hahella chejuensis KCTC 2396]
MKSAIFLNRMDHTFHYRNAVEQQEANKPEAV